MERSQEQVLRRGASPLGRVAQAIRARPRAARWALAGPGALAVAFATLAAMPTWLPAGPAGIDNIALPILLTPLLWAVPFFYACLEENLPRGAATLLGAVVLQGALVAFAFTG